MKKKSLVTWLSAIAVALVFVCAGWYVQRAQAQTGASGGGGNMGFNSSYYLYPSAITERGGYLYIVHGNTLYKYAAKDMTLVKRVELSPPPTEPFTPGGFGGG